MPDYIDAHLADRFTLTDLAGVACLSPYHFSGSFSSALRHAMSGSSAIDADLTTIFAPPSRSNVRIGTLHHDARQPAFVRADSRTGVRSYIRRIPYSGSRCSTSPQKLHAVEIKQPEFGFLE